jgi:2-C-methyl-D-erythritol 4-phosphate cytidylyltransferase
MTVAAILVAAGAGTRLGAGVPKAFCLVKGRTLLDHALSRFVEHEDVRHVIAVVPAGFVAELAGFVAELGDGVVVVAGGDQRSDSVAAGLAALPDEVEFVLVHDAARPFVPAAVITRVVAALRSGADAVIPAIPVVDTVKRVFEGVVVETIDRSALRAVQTPQGFRRSVLAAAHAQGAGATDDAALVERAGVEVAVVDGADESFKITRPWDLMIAEALA